LICQVYSQIFEIFHSFENSATFVPEYWQSILFAIIPFLFDFNIGRVVVGKCVNNFLPSALTGIGADLNVVGAKEKFLPMSIILFTYFLSLITFPVSQMMERRNA